jgi:pimeloyl-ACP methyl ester carboxylesterase
VRLLVRWTVRVCIVLVTVLCVTLITGWAYEYAAETFDAHRYPPPGIMVPVGGHKVDLFCEGTGTPTVVMETGSGEPAVLFRPIQEKVAELTRACSYDRAGIGWSEANLKLQTIQDRAAELYALLRNADVPGPYVLVAHSYGGLIARIFVRDHPADVRGLVLVDAAEEGYVFLPDFLDAIRGSLALRRRSELLARLGVPRLRFSLNHEQFGIRTDLLGDVRGEMIAFFSKPSFVRATTDEGRSYLFVPNEMRRPGGFGALNTIPLIVIRHGQPSNSILVPSGISQDQFEKLWAEGQERLKNLSSNSEIVVATKSGHMVNLDQPELVIDAARRVVTSVRAGVPVSQVR